MHVLDSTVEKDLLVRLKSGDQMAFKQIYDSYAGRIYGRLLRLSKSELLADELLQDTFVKLWEKRHQIDYELSCKAWLYKVAENELYSFYRKVARDKKLQEHIMATFTEIYAHTEEDIFLRETTDLLNRAMDKLPPQGRQVFTLCKIEGKSYEEAAVKLGISPFTVSNHLVRANKSVRAYISANQDALMLAVTAQTVAILHHQ